MDSLSLMQDHYSPEIRQALFDQYITQARGILHLGAHLGQERAYYADLGKPVTWVEAFPDIHARLQRNIAPYENQHALCALIGDKDGVQTPLHLSNNAEGVSSSIFHFGTHGSGKESLWPELDLKMVSSVTLPMIRLDTLLASNRVASANYDFWVVDLQGAELLALQGAGELLERCSALYVEASTVEVYRGGVLWNELSTWLDHAGFVPLWQPERPHDMVLLVKKGKIHTVLDVFHSDHYLRHNMRRLEHIASLGLQLSGKRVLEAGAGIGDHTSFYADRACQILALEVRPENLVIMRQRFSAVSDVRILHMDLDNPFRLKEKFDIVHCYGLLYHLQRPEQALTFLAEHCQGMLLLETCVSYGDDLELHPVSEDARNYCQGFYGRGCRPTRPWVWTILNRLFEYVYVTRTQPAHEEFPLNWTVENPDQRNILMRSVFVAARQPLNNPLLAEELLLKHLPLV